MRHPEVIPSSIFLIKEIKIDVSEKFAYLDSFLFDTVNQELSGIATLVSVKIETGKNYEFKIKK